MNLFHIAWRNMQQRGLATILTMLSMALGVCMVVLVLGISWVITESFSRNSNVGYNLIVGARGGSLQLTLNAVYYLSQPVGTIPYELFLEFLPGDGRAEEIHRVGGKIEEPDRKGLYSPYMSGGFAIPVCLGDYFGRFRVVGTTPDFFEKLQYGEMNDLKYRFASGRNFKDYDAENGYFEAVLGAQCAAERKCQVGDTLKTTHGDPEGDGHGQAFKIVGILEPTGTPNDRAAFINIEGFYLMEGHARAFENPMHPDADKEDVGEGGAQLPPRLALEKRDITAILVRTGNPMFAMNMQTTVKKSEVAEAASPIFEIGNLFSNFVDPVRYALLAVTTVVCFVSAISILVSIYNSMNERRRDIAVMRALGARRDVVLFVVLLESLLIACLGGLLGWLAGHSLGAVASSMIEYRSGVRVTFVNTITYYELWLIPGLVILATIAGVVPAFVAYQTNVSKNLGA
ncbi:MAG: ABC transporter permease [Planctomycetales bacterium]|nr:ABC transporter permease [Planctomycetales bacterium]